MSGSYAMTDRKPTGAHQNYGYEGSKESIDSHPSGIHHNDVAVIGDADKSRHDDDDEGERIEATGCLGPHLMSIQDTIEDLWDQHNIWFWRIFFFLLALAYLGYFGYAMHYEKLKHEESIRLLWVTALFFLCLFLYFVYQAIHKFYGESISEACTMGEGGQKTANIISWVVLIIVIVGFIVFIIVDVTVITKEPYNLMSVVGIVVYVLLLFVFSYSPAHVNWRTVLWGLALQFIFALFILRWDRGYDAFQWLGDRVSEFLTHSDAGASFIFGNGYEEHFVVFKVLPVIIFFSSFVSIMYYLGWMQVLINFIAIGMQYTMGTTAGESLNAAGNIFIGQSEASLLIRPLIKDMTKSELHAIMTGGFATIAGSVMAAYILFGVPANHLLSASVMSAPAALAMAKLFYPETRKSKTTAKDVMIMEKSGERNVIDAASAGASASISLVANIAANLIAFIALIHFLDATLTWFGNRVGIEELTFAYICSYVLYPFAFVMGADVNDCRPVAKLLGYKTFINEFYAYTEMSVYLNNKDTLRTLTATNNTWWWHDDRNITVTNSTFEPVLLEEGILTERSEVIATYALCGFANIGSIGIMIGILSAMAPERKQDIATIAIRAMIAGNVACFLTACIAGLLFEDKGGTDYKAYEVLQP